MVFWVSILIGCLFTWLAVKIRFYEIWVLLFNIVIAIYLAVFLGPLIANIVPVAGNSPYNNAICMIITAVAAFLILHGISYTFLTGQFSVPFHKAFDTLGAGILGFLTGFLLSSFVSLLICITPMSKNTFVEEIGFADQFKQTGVPYISWWCDRINSIVASKDSDITSKDVISVLLKTAETKETPQKRVQPEKNQPTTPNID